MADRTFDKGEVCIFLRQPFVKIIRIVALETKLVLPFKDGIRFQMGDEMIPVACSNSR